MGWVVVPNLDECRDQLNQRFPNRDKSSDGSIGDTSHQASSSSHNPDKTGSPEYRDGDAKDEVRARDIDADLQDPDVTMEMVVQLWVTLARAGVLWWVRYMIYKGRIWHKRDGYVTRSYNGTDNHNSHLHLNSDFTQEADEVRNTDWHLRELGSKPTPVSNPMDHLDVDGELGPKTIAKWQKIMGTAVDGFITAGNSDLVRAVQRKLKSLVDHRLVVDGDGIYQNGRPYHTIGALQRYLKSPVDEVLSVPKSECVKALQRRLNEGWF